MAIPRAYLQAIFKYAPIVAPVAKQYGINGRQLLARLGMGESHFNPGAVSSAGAKGATQFMPATRADYMKRYGVDAWKNPDEAIHATALYLKSGGSLASYNPGMPSYTNYILGQHVGNLAKQLRNAGGAPQANLSNVTPNVNVAPAAETRSAKAGQLMDIFSKMNQAVPSAQPNTPTNPYPNLGPTQQDFSNNYKLIAQLGDHTAPSAPAAGLSSVGAQGKVVVAAGANRAGVSIQPIVFDFLKGLAGLVGHKITIGTGTNHDKMTVNGNVSDHWDGHASDIPAAGASLIRLGQQALINAGMPHSQALKQTGGLYNLQWNGHRVQIIFNTHEGGDHTNHLHVGIR